MSHNITAGDTWQLQQPGWVCSCHSGCMDAKSCQWQNGRYVLPSLMDFAELPQMLQLMGRWNVTQSWCELHDIWLLCLQAWWFCCNKCCRFMLQGLSLCSPQATRWEMSGQAIEAHTSLLQFFSAFQSLLQCNCPSRPKWFESSKLHVCFSWEVEFLSQMLLWPPSEFLLVLCYKSHKVFAVKLCWPHLMATGLLHLGVPVLFAGNRRATAWWYFASSRE